MIGGELRTGKRFVASMPLAEPREGDRANRILPIFSMFISGSSIYLPRRIVRPYGMSQPNHATAPICGY